MREEDFGRALEWTSKAGTSGKEFFF